MDQFFDNPGFIHIGQEILSYLTLQEIIDLRAVSPNMKNFVEQMDICHPLHWLKKCVQVGIKRKVYEKWMVLIRENQDMQFVIFGMVMQMYKNGIKKKKKDGKWAKSYSFDYFGGPCRFLYNTIGIVIFEKNFNFLHKASMIECCFNIIVGPLKSKDGKYIHYSSVLPSICMWNKDYRGDDYSQDKNRYFFLKGDPENSQKPLKVIREYTKESNRNDCTSDYKASAAPLQKRNRLIK